MKIVREVTLRCSNCHCGVKVEEIKIGKEKGEVFLDDNGIGAVKDLLFTVVKDGKD